MAAVVSHHHHHLFSTLTRFNSTRRESQSRRIGINSVRCSVVSTSENRLVTLSNGNDSLDICRVLNGMWQTSGGWGRIDRDDAGLSTFDMADHFLEVLSNRKSLQYLGGFSSIPK